MPGPAATPSRSRPRAVAGSGSSRPRSAYAERLANATTASQQNRYRRKLPAIGLRARSCLQDFNPSTQGFEVTSTFNDPEDWLVRDAFQTPTCPPPGVCLAP